MNKIKEILIRRDKLTPEAAEDLIQEAETALYNYLREGKDYLAYDICQEYFGLEPDYLDELMY